MTSGCGVGLGQRGGRVEAPWWCPAEPPCGACCGGGGGDAAADDDW